MLRIRIPRPASGFQRSRDFRCELGNVIDAELLLQFRYLIDGHIKAVTAESFAFDVLELLAHGVVLVTTDDFMESREEHGIFPSLMGSIHADEGCQRGAGGLHVIGLD